MGIAKGRLHTTLSLLIVVVASHISLAQSPDKPWDKNLFDNKETYKVAYKEFQKGESFYKQGVYSKALEHYLPAQDFNPNNSSLNMRIGQCYLYSSSKLKAKTYLLKALELNDRINISIYLLLGNSHQLEMEWFRAIEQYEKFIKNAAQDDTDRIFLARKRIKECKFGQKATKKPIDIKIEGLPGNVNSKFAEYHPLISADEAVMYFTSRRDYTTGGNRDENYDVYYEDIYKTKQVDSTWSEPVGIGERINTELHDATVGISPDGQQLYIYKDDNGDGNIYICELDGDEWSAPVKLDEKINSEYNETTACFSFDGMTIYFVSDRPGGFGKNDIYTTKKNEAGEWGEVKNLGASVNTRYNEDAVFMHPDGRTLYYSSEGHSSIGGFDIFNTVYDSRSKSWSTPKNMGYPINSPDDDVFFVLAASGDRGYYSSIKSDGVGEKDIYMITFPDNQAKPELTLVKGIILDSKTGLPIYADIEIIDNETGEVIARLSTNKLTGEYLFSLPSGKDYGITVTANGFFFHSENIDVPSAAPYFEMINDIDLSRIGVGKSIVLNFLYFEYDKATLTPKSLVELERVLDLMNTNPQLKIEISGHTDNKGSEAYNMRLSKRRAEAVVLWLASEKIDKAKMTSKGYAFSQPIESNATEEGRAKNRRTEFKVLEYKPNEKRKEKKVPPKKKKPEPKTAPEPEPIEESTPEPEVEPKPAVEAKKEKKKKKPESEPKKETTPEPEPKPVEAKKEKKKKKSEPVAESKKEKKKKQPEPEPVVEPDPIAIGSEPVVEPEPKPVLESKPEPVVEPKPDPVVEPEPTPEPEPVFSIPAMVAEEPPAAPVKTEPVATGLRTFSSSKPNYYNSNKIDVDPQLPSGVVYKVQIGSFSKLPTGASLKGLYPVTAMKLDNGLFRCSIGEFRTYKKAKEAQKIIRATGFPDAFLIAFYNGNKTSVSKAINLE